MIQTIKNKDLSILIVDDSDQYAMVLTKLLKNVFGYSVIEVVGDSKEALDYIKANPDKFEMFFVDYNFPNGFNGGDLLAELNSSGILSDKIAFMITSEPSIDNVKQAQQQGAVGVVTKPFDREELSRQLQKADRLLATRFNDSF